MITSKELEFSVEQAITVTAPSENIIDLGKTGSLMKSDPFLRDVGRGTKIPLRIQVVEDFAGAASMHIEVQTANDEAFTSPVTHAQTISIPVADLKVGRIAEWDTVPIAVQKQRMGRYMRLRYVVPGTASAGKITAMITGGNNE